MTTLPPVTDPPQGSVLVLGKSDWRYGKGRLVLRVDQVRHDLSRYYDNEWVWIVGDALGPDGTPERRMKALVRVAAINPR